MTSDGDKSNAEHIDKGGKVSPKGISRFKQALNKEMEEVENEYSINTPEESKAMFDFKGRFLNQENDNQHKFYMRNNLYSMLYILVQNDKDHRELESMFSFMDKCKDSTVLNEVCQLLLCFIIEMGTTALRQIINACSSPEGFTSFVIFRLTSHPSEEVRSSAIRLLTHFYHRMGDFSNTTGKQNILAIPQVFESQRMSQSINGLQESGGLHLLMKMLENKYCAESSILTYSALLEMLMTVPGSDKKMYKYADADKNSENSGKIAKTGALRVFALAPFTLSQCTHASEDEDCINERILNHFFNLVPKLHESIEDRLYMDFVTLLKQNSINRDAFCANPHWNKFIFQLAKRYVELVSDSPLILRNQDLATCLYEWSEEAQNSKGVTTPPKGPSPRRKPSLRIYTEEGAELPINSSSDLRFAMCMKLNSTLVVHATRYKNGWLSFFRLLVVMLDAPERTVLSQAMLSHSLNELTFGMHSRFKDLLTKVVSEVPAVKQDAYDQLENFLVLIIIVCLHVLSAPVSAVDVESSHLWHCLHISDIKPEIVDGKIIIKEGPQFVDELLHPLERNHHSDNGKVVLVLQCLRFFDIMFNPSENGTLRNSQILKYCIRNLDRKSQNDPDRERLSLLGAAIRMCLFVQRQLCPFSELADVNLLRLTHLVRTLDRVPQKNTPTESWILVILSSTFQLLKRISASLSSIFRDFGLEDHEALRNSRFTPSADLKLKDEEAYDNILGDLASLTRLEVLFDSRLGSRLIIYVRHSVHLLAEIFKQRSDSLFLILGETIFEAYKAYVSFLLSDQLTLAKRSSPARRRLSKSMSTASVGALNPAPARSPRGRPKSMGSEIEAREEWADFSETASEITFDPFTPATSSKDTFLCDDVISCFRFLRDPFFLHDLPHCDAVVSAVEVARTHEKKSIYDFCEDLLFLKSKMPSDDVVLGRNLNAMPTWTNNARMQRSAEIALTKFVAASWQSCLRIFEAEWSPWHSTDEEGLKCFELTRHVDRFCRRMVLTRSGDPIDHSGALYYNEKRRLGVQESAATDAAIDLAVPSSFLRDALKLTMDSRKQNMGEDWGNETSFILEENAPALQEKRPQWSVNYDWAADEVVVYSSEASMVCLECTMSGTVVLTNRHLYFNPRKQTGGLINDNQGRYLKTRRWVLECLQETFGRRHLLKNCGIELFFAFSQEVFLAFNSLKELQKFFFTLRRQHVPYLTTPATLNPKQVCAALPWTELWRRRLISNFEYLIALNKMAGRSFNDITQYPVFPWIIADYTSKLLDLANPATFRDLRRPIGALNESRLAEIMERYNNSFDDVEIPKFMYGSHYSSAGVVLHYLIRQEPFTTMAVHFQGGKFDCPDRLFFNFNNTWESLNLSLTDVKESIPEFFYCPEMLLNTNKLPLGPLQDGVTIVDDVVLPPWAKDAFDFVRINREALESDFVSENLHHWIDLIFGYKQTGDAAIEAKNLFYYLTYENAINIDEIADRVTRDATISQVVNFGQTPSQLFTKPHPQRMPRSECINFLCSDKFSVDTSELELFTFTPHVARNQAMGPVIAIQSSKTQLIAYHADFTLSYFKFAAVQDNSLPLPQQLRFEKSRESPAVQLSMHSVLSVKRVTSEHDAILRGASKDSHIEPTNEVSSSNDEGRTILGKLGNLFKMGGSSKSLGEEPVKRRFYSHDDSEMSLASNHIHLSVVDGGMGRIVSCGYWDNSLRVHNVDTLKEVACSTSPHVGMITCVHADKQGGRTIVTGGSDGTCRVWLLESPQLFSCFEDDLRPKGVDDVISDPNLVCVHVLCGHQSPVTAIYYSSDLDLVMSGSKDGIVCLHSASRGEFIRAINRLQGESIDVLFISPQGYLVVHSWSVLKVLVFWTNGQLLSERTSDLSVSAEEDVAERCLLLFMLVFKLILIELIEWNASQLTALTQRLSFVGAARGTYSSCFFLNCSVFGSLT